MGKGGDEGAVDVGEEEEWGSGGSGDGEVKKFDEVEYWVSQKLFSDLFMRM